MTNSLQRLGVTGTSNTLFTLAMFLGALFFGSTAITTMAHAAEQKNSLENATGLILHRVTATPATFAGRNALAVQLTDAAQQEVLQGNAKSDGPNFALMDFAFANGTIEVDIAAKPNGKGAPDARGFAGLAFHIDREMSTFDGVYLRMDNGSKNNPLPQSPRLDRAVQYFSYPNRTWHVLREKFPGLYEDAAPVAVGQWHTLRLEVQGRTVKTFVDGKQVLVVKDISFPQRTGRIGLWVDDGTIAYFSNLRVTKK